MRFYEAFLRRTRAVDENDFWESLYAFLRRVLRETLRTFYFLFCLLLLERSMKLFLAKFICVSTKRSQRYAESFIFFLRFTTRAVDENDLILFFAFRSVELC